MINDETPIKPATPAPSEPAVHSSAWLAAVEEAIKSMKYREDDCRRKADDAILKAQTISDERNKLENLLYKAGLRS